MNGQQQVKGNQKKFSLKWVPGTTVSRCYGCGNGIDNPPLSGPDDIVVVYKDVREYRDRVTGQKQLSPSPQNVHFHLREACIKQRYPGFDRSQLVVPMEFCNFLRHEHRERLLVEFGIQF